MNKEIMKRAGFKKEIERFEGGICPFCQRHLTKDEFRDRKSLKEYRISGLCQECQDKMFGKN